ncbi:hypothetical protein [Cardinium endosymbiont of Culicoides punctatus]|uniref:hypothetical protein n=1 Tax=Cardinium endosymbiont of Culicoides punctatus TaxID=2304601 RepID=UPI0010590469|nr:hypothetical protein [Cardinium endosymbiont of Culicoides punctatus]TDG95274.1 hypothetical protein CCPUN_05270 [Cardinium endosymbiont of Culicoides punctatus]
MIKFKYLKLVIYLLLLLLGQSCSNHQLLSITSRRKRPYNHANHESDKKKGRSEEKEQNIAGFSKWTPKMFNDQFHIDFKIENIESFKPEKEIINKDNLEFIIKSFKRIIETRGGFTNIEGKEATFSNYPNILITEMVHEVSQERVSNNKSKIFLSDQYTYGGTMAKGDVDLVVRIKSSPNYSDNILFVTEVKKPSTLEDGLLQNCMELYTAYEQNSIKEDVYGVVTCGNLWIFTTDIPH